MNPIIKKELNPYILAMKDGNGDKIKEFITQGYDPNIKYNGSTLLFYVIFNRNIDMVNFLLEHDAFIDIQNDNYISENEIIQPFDSKGFEFTKGQSPVGLALEKNDTEIIELFLKKYPVNEQLSDWISKELLLGIVDNDLEKIEFCLQNHASIYTWIHANHGLFSGNRDYQYDRLKNYEYKYKIDLLLDKNNIQSIKLVMKYDSSSSKLAEWLFMKDIKVIQEFIDYGVDVNTLLCFAIIKKNTALVEFFLVSYKIDTDKLFIGHDEHKFWKGQTPLSLSIAFDLIEVVKPLLKAGANPNLEPLLKKACENQNLKIVKLLVEYGADVNATNDEGQTALFDAIEAKRANVEIIRFLITHGADINKEDDKGITPLIFAQTNKKSLVKTLTESVISKSNIVDITKNQDELKIEKIKIAPTEKLHSEISSLNRSIANQEQEIKQVKDKLSTTQSEAEKTIQDLLSKIEMLEKKSEMDNKKTVIPAFTTSPIKEASLIKNDGVVVRRDSLDDF